MDYYNRKNLIGAVKDLWRVDKFHMFYKGLFCSTIACANLIIANEICELLSFFPNDKVRAVAPLVFVMGTLMAHPFFLLSMRVQCGHFANTLKLREAYRNMFNAVSYITRTKGMKGYYEGYFASLAIYMLMSFTTIRTCIKMNYKNYLMSLQGEEFHKEIEEISKHLGKEDLGKIEKMNNKEVNELAKRKAEEINEA